MLVNRDVILNGASGLTVYYSVDGGPSPPAPITNNIIDTYFLDGSVLALYTNSSSVNPQTSEIIKSDESRIFESGAWRDQIVSGPPSSTTMNIDAISYAFITSPSPSGAKRGDNTYGVADMLVAYMNAYSSWANMTPCFSNQGQPNNSKIPENVLLCTILQCLGVGGGPGNNCGNQGGAASCTLVQ
jgi:hypothetical protein